MGSARFITDARDELARVDVELVELLSRVRGALGWNVTTEGEVRVEYDAERISEQTLTNALKGLGFKPVPAAVPVLANYTYPIRQTGRSRR